MSVVEDDPATRRVMRLALERGGYRVAEFDTGRSLLDALTDEVACVCVDLGLDDMPGEDVLRHLRARDPDLPTVVVTARKELDTAIAAMKAGAYDYVAKPVDTERLLAATRRACEHRALSRRVHSLEQALGDREALSTIVGRSPAMRELARQVERVRESDVTVCLFGESGTGKEVVARAIHATSQRRQGPFVAINCAAVPASLQESELFGHERGAFTGATATHKGRFEQARGGTLFLDELGEMSPETQAVLLRTLQERTIRRVGGTGEIPVDVRIVCATHRDLRSLVERGRFREDLYFRLVVYPVQLPPLRDRQDDVPELIGHFLRQLRADVGRPVDRVHPDALAALTTYRWPGNVRELMNVVHRSMLSCPGTELRLSDLPPEVQRATLPGLPTTTEPARTSTPILAEDEVVPLEVLERRAIEHALRATKASVGRAAKLLGIGRATLYRKLAAFDIQVDGRHQPDAPEEGGELNGRTR